MRNMSLTKASLLLNTVVFSAVCMVLFGVLQLRNHIDLVGDAWLQFEKERQEKVRLENALCAALGYGGVIHDYKNYILRGGEQRVSSVKQKVGNAHNILKQFETLGTTAAEAVAIADIRTVLGQYQQAIDRVQVEKSQGAISAREIDRRATVNVALAQRGLETLRRENSPKGELVDDRRTKAALLGALRSSVGLGGMIFHYKEYLLGQQVLSATRAREAIAQGLKIIADYRKTDISRAEEVGLADIEAMLKHYRNALVEMAQLIKEGRAVEEIDRLVELDDSYAIRGFGSLEREVARSIESHSGTVTDTMASIGGVETFTLWSLLVGAITTGILILWLIQGHVVSPIKKLSAAMNDMAAGNLKVRVPEVDRANEIGEMARAMEYFRLEAINRRRAEAQLEGKNREVEEQLKTVQELRERSDRQAGQAITLAEGLTKAHEDAETAILRAEADEHRIRAILDTVKDAIITSDELGTIETFNPGASAIFGYTQDEVIGRNVSLLMPEPMRSEHPGYMARYQQGEPTRLVGQTVEQLGLHRDGSQFPIEITIGVMMIEGQRKFTGVIRDITDRKRAEKEVRRLAMSDPLTGLANRNRFHEALEEAFRMAQRRKWQLALVSLDLDRFKPVNDTYGHQVGDKLLVEVAARLRKISRESDTVARLGGDEFSIILINIVDREATVLPAQRILDEIGRPFDIDGHQLEIGVSIGIALYPEDADTTETLLSRSDQALYAAKAGGRNRYCHYSSELKQT